MTDYEQLTIRSRADWRRWLEANHDTTNGVWLVRFKKGNGPHVASMTHAPNFCSRVARRAAGGPKPTRPASPPYANGDS